MPTSMFEGLESRQMFASTLDTAWNTTGVSTVNFRTSAADPAVLSTQIVTGPGVDTAYVLARTKSTVQLARLRANGTLDTGFAKNGLMVVPTASADDSAEVQATAVGNPILLVGNKVYRFDGSGQTLDPNFGSGGVLTLTDFTGGIDIDVDESNKIYVTGRTKKNDGLLVERFISRGKLDKTFSDDGVVNVPIVSTARKLGGATGNGEMLRSFAGDDASVAADNTIVVAGRIGAKGYGDGVQVAKLNYDGTFVTGYGKNGGGVASVLGPQTTDRNEGFIKPVAVVNGGGVVIEAEQTFHGDRTDDVTHFGGAFTATGSRIATGLFNLTATIDDYSGGYVGLSSTGTVNVNNSNYVGPLDASGVVSRFDSDFIGSASLNDNGRPITGVLDIASGGTDDDGLILYTAGLGSKAGTVNVARYLPGLLPPLS